MSDSETCQKCGEDAKAPLPKLGDGHSKCRACGTFFHPVPDTVGESDGFANE